MFYNVYMEEERSYKQALNLSYYYLKIRDRTEKELRDYLFKKSKKFEWEDGIIDPVIEKLKKLDYLNDARFTEWFVRSRNRSKQKSEFLLKQELLQKGVSQDILENYFFSNPLEEVDLAKKALEPKWQRFSQFDQQKRFEKSVAFLSRRGFSFDVIKKTVALLEQTE